MATQEAEDTSSSSANCSSQRRARTRPAYYHETLSLPALPAVPGPSIHKKRREAKREDKNKLQPITVLEQSEGQVKVHYEGYSKLYDEWKDEGGIFPLGLEADEDPDEDPLPVSLTEYEEFCNMTVRAQAVHSKVLQLSLLSIALGKANAKSHESGDTNIQLQ